MVSTLHDERIVVPTETLVKNHCAVYTKDIKGLNKLNPTDVAKNAGWNLHLFCPLNKDVFEHPDQSGDFDTNSFIRVIHSEYKVVAIFSKANFKEWNNKEVVAISAFKA
jgi:hypothetical protein